MATLSETVAGEFDVVATSGDITRQLTLNFEFAPEGEQVTPVLTSPEQNASGVGLSPELSWEGIAEAEEYVIEISEEADFSSGVTTGVTQENVFESPELIDDQRYYWRVSAVTTCGQQPFSEAKPFHTKKLICESYESQDIPKPINLMSSIVSSEIEAGLQGEVERITLSLHGIHEDVTELSASLTSPQWSSKMLFSSLCSSTGGEDFNLGFSDTSTQAAIPCPPTSGGYYVSEESLNNFSGEEASGVWVLEVSDNWPFFNNGELQGWALNVCIEDEGVPTFINEQRANSDVEVYPNPAFDVLSVVQSGKAASSLAYDVYSSTGVKCLSGKLLQGEEKIIVGQLSAGVYIVLLTDDEGEVYRKKIVKISSI